MGVGRTFQVVRSFPRLPLLDNVMVGAYGAGLPDHAAVECGDRARCIVSGCAARPAVAAGQLTNKQLRLMELARALAGRPRLLLLDETLAGLGREECDDVLDVLHAPARRGHDDRDHRAHHARDDADRRPLRRAGPWRVLATGLPGTVVEDRSVIEAYLGKKWLATAGCLRSEPSCRLWRLARADRRVADRGRGPVRHRRRAQRRRQVDAVQDDLRRRPRRAAARSLPRRGSAVACPPPQRAHLGIAHVPEGRQVFKTLTVRENLEMGAYPQVRPRAMAPHAGPHPHAVPDPGRTRHPAGRHAVGRRAADGRDRPRAGLARRSC